MKLRLSRINIIDIEGFFPKYYNAQLSIEFPGINGTKENPNSGTLEIRMSEEHVANKTLPEIEATAIALAKDLMAEAKADGAGEVPPIAI